MDWGQVVIIGVPIVLGLGFVWVKAEKALRALDEAGDIFELLPKILDDKKLTPEELVLLKKEVNEAVAAFKAIFKK